MAIELAYIESFDRGDPPTPLWSLNGARKTPGLTGSHGVYLGGNPNLFILPTALQGIVFGVRQKLYSITGSSDQLLYIKESGGDYHLTIAQESNGALSIRQGNMGTAIATSAAGVIQANVTFYIEVKVSISDSAGVCVVRVNGVTVAGLSLTNTDTKHATSPTIHSVGICSADGIDQGEMDDFYILSLANDAPYNDFQGVSQMIEVVPNAAGAYTEMTPSTGSNYACVDETGSPTDTDYVQADSNNQRDLYKNGGLGGASGAIIGVKPWLRGKKDASGAAQMASFLKSGITEYVGEAKVMADSYAYYDNAVLFTDPNTSAAWQTANFDTGDTNRLQIGVKRVA